MRATPPHPKRVFMQQRPTTPSCDGVQIVEAAERGHSFLVRDPMVVPVGHSRAQTPRAIGSQYHERPVLGRHLRAQHEDLHLRLCIAVAVQELAFAHQQRQHPGAS